MKNVMKTYTRQDVVFEKGNGVWLYDTEGNAYLDFVAGVAVNCLGHSHPKIVKAMSDQLSQLMHVSNLYWTKQQTELAQKLCEYANMQSVFFCNSGTEALETAFKIGRKYGYNTGQEKTKVIVLEKGFHGRTMGALSLTWNENYKTPYKPLIQNVVAVPANDMESLKSAVDEEVCAIIMEPIQGEGGIYPLEDSFVQLARQLADENDALLIFDEVQCGMSRTGTLFAHEKFSIKPDVLCLAKGLGAGMPIGAVIVNAKADILVPGDHGSTFGGNPLACSAGLTVLDIVAKPEFLEQVKDVSEYLVEKLKELGEKQGSILEIRGQGLMLGVELTVQSKQVIANAFEQGLLLIGAGPKAVRLLPPLNIEKEEIDAFIDKFESVLESVISMDKTA